jgi:hypothetical protein
MALKWRRVGVLKVTQSWKFSTFLHGQYFRLTHNGDGDRYLIGYWDFPVRGTLYRPHRIYTSTTPRVLEIPAHPFSQICIGVTNELELYGLRVVVETTVEDP